jgi:RimJ/RimL family protein N-acetyltransferase
VNSRLAVRAATEADISDIVRLHEHPHVRAFLDPPSERQVRDALARESAAQFLIESDRGCEALLLLGYMDDWLVELRRIAVARPHCGIGRFGVEWVLKHAFEERGAHRVYLEVHARNERARRLYESAGFTHEGTFRDGTRHWESRAFEDLCAYGKLAV